MLRRTIQFCFYTTLFLRTASAQADEGIESLDGEVAESPTEWISGLPLICGEGCLIPANTYYVCNLNTTLLDGSTADQGQCDDYLCVPDNYDHLRACLECIVANGNERPWGYHTNSALTAPVTDEPFSPAAPPVGGYLDRSQGEAWLANVTDRCSSIGRALDSATTTLLASPTTTGPYATSWTSGETIAIPIWTGLTEYSELFFPSVTPVWGEELASSTGTSSSRSTVSVAAPSSSASGTSESASSTASAAVEASSSPNAGSVAVPLESLLCCIGLLGYFWL